MNSANKRFNKQFKSFKGKALGVLALELMVLAIVFTVKASMMLGGEKEAIERYAQLSETYAAARYADSIEVVTRTPQVVEDVVLDTASNEGDETSEAVVDDPVADETGGDAVPIEEDNAVGDEDDSQSNISDTGAGLSQKPALDGSVDWAGLVAINADTVGWITLDGTSINYPVVQGADNSKYLRYSFENTADKNGAIFADSRIDVDGDVFVLYGHNMGRTQKVMFSQLRYFLEEDYFAKTKTLEFEHVWESGISEWDIFAVVPMNVVENSGKLPVLFGKVGRDLLISSIQKNALFLRNIDAVGNRQVVVLVTCNGAAGTPDRIFVYAAKKG